MSDGKSDTMNRGEQKREAIARLQMFDVDDKIIQVFCESSRIGYFDYPKSYTFSPTEEEKAQVKKFEKQYNTYVYAVLKSHTSFGELYSYLSVGAYLWECMDDRKAIKEAKEHPMSSGVLAYVYNATYPTCSEFGLIGVGRSDDGGLQRLW